MFVGGIFTTDERRLAAVSVARVELDTGALDQWTIPAGTIVAPQVAWTLLPIGNRLYGGFGRGPNYSAAFRLDNGDVGSQVWRFSTVGNDESMVMSNDGTRLFVGGHFGTAVLTSRPSAAQPLHGLMSLNPLNGALYCDWLPAITPSGRQLHRRLGDGLDWYMALCQRADRRDQRRPAHGPRALPALTDHTLSPLSGDGGRAHPFKGRIITTAWFASFHQPVGSHTGSKPQRCQNARVPA